MHASQKHVTNIHNTMEKVTENRAIYPSVNTYAFTKNIIICIISFWKIFLYEDTMMEISY